MSRPSALERARQTRRLLRSEGVAGVTLRLRERAAANVAPPREPRRLPVARADLVRVGRGRRRRLDAARAAARRARRADDRRLGHGARRARAPAAHTTMFRMVAALEPAGHTCVVYLDDQHGWSIDQHIAHDPRVVAVGAGRDARPRRRHRGRARHRRHRLGHRLSRAGARPARGTRFYLVQDFEPSFYPAGSEAMLAEATYRFGFHGVTAGRWLAERLPRDYGMAADHFDFGCDLERYGLDTSPGRPSARTAVCYYCRPSTPRRAYELAVRGARPVRPAPPGGRHPPVRRARGRLPFAATDHGLLTPEQLNELYNRCIAGLVAVGHERVARAARDARRGLRPGRQRRRAQPDRARQPRGRVRRRHAVRARRALSALVERDAAERAAAAAAAAASVQLALVGRRRSPGRADRARGRGRRGPAARRVGGAVLAPSVGVIVPCYGYAERARGLRRERPRAGGRRRARPHPRRLLARPHARGRRPLAARDPRVDVPARGAQPGPDRDRQRGARLGRRETTSCCCRPTTCSCRARWSARRR